MTVPESVIVTKNEKTGNWDVIINLMGKTFHAVSDELKVEMLLASVIGQPSGALINISFMCAHLEEIIRPKEPT